MLKVFLFFFCLTQFSYTQWFVQDTIPALRVNYFSSSNGWMLGIGGLILKSSDGGETWLPKPNVTTHALSGISFLNDDTGTIVGQKGTILRTTDSGESWVMQFGGTSENFLIDLTYIDENNGIIVGHTEAFTGMMLKTTDGGITWNSYTPAIPDPLSAITFTDQNNGWILGLNTVLKTTDGGATWKIQLTNFNALRAISFFDENNGIVVGSGIILRTSDGGVNWTQSFIINTLNSVTHVDNNVVFAAGHDFDQNPSSVILKSVDGGITWNRQDTTLAISLGGISFADNNHGTALGGGFILRTTNGGITFVEDGLTNPRKKDFQLLQNYPNPFNPLTNIDYIIQKLSFVNLTVFDIFGKEVAILVNEEKFPGRYSLKFNPSGLASGLYFYKLSINGYSESRKMLYLK